MVAHRQSSQWLLLDCCPKILGGGRDLQMVLCHSMNAGWGVGKLRGGGDTQTLPAVIKFIWTFCTQRQWGCKNIFLAPAHTLVPQQAISWKYNYLIFVIILIIADIPMQTDHLKFFVHVTSEYFQITVEIYSLKRSTHFNELHNQFLQTCIRWEKYRSTRLNSFHDAAFFVHFSCDTSQWIEIIYERKRSKWKHRPLLPNENGCSLSQLI